MDSPISDSQIKSLLKDLDRDLKGDFKERPCEDKNDEAKLEEVANMGLIGRKKAVDNLLESLNRYS